VERLDEEVDVEDDDVEDGLTSSGRRTSLAP